MGMWCSLLVGVVQLEEFELPGGDDGPAPLTISVVKSMAPSLSLSLFFLHLFARKPFHPMCPQGLGTVQVISVMAMRIPWLGYVCKSILLQFESAP